MRWFNTAKAERERQQRVFVVEGDPSDIASKIAEMYHPNAEAHEMFARKNLPKHSSRMYGVFLFPENMPQDMRDAVFETSEFLPLFLDTVVTDNIRQPDYAVVSAGYSPKYPTQVSEGTLRDLGFKLINL